MTTDSDGLALRIEGVSKRYGAALAVDGLDLEIGRGEVFGFLGPNGAGKTTAVKICLDLVRPTSGSATVLGRPSLDWRARRQVGFLPEHFRFQEWLTAREFLDVHARLCGVPAPLRRERAAELLEQLGLSRQADQQLRDFSKGMLQRVGLAQALIHRPQLVFLDEPTSGLDPLGRRLVRDVIQDLRRQGTTVFLNSHLLSEIEITCDRVGFVRRGRLIACGPLSQFLAPATEVEVTLDPESPRALPGWAELTYPYEAEDGLLRVRLPNESQVPELVGRLVALGARIQAVHPRRVSLEDVFLEIMAGEEAG